jgi:flagellar hook assembly protein FlgD
VWDGKNDSGAIARDGVYTYRISATDRAQNSPEAFLENIVINTIRPVVNVIITDPWFNPVGVKNTVGMDLSVPVKNEVTGWTIQIKDREGSLKRTISGGSGGGPGSAWTATGIVSVPERYAYDGKNDSGAVLAEGEYFGELAVTYLNGLTSSAVSPVFNLRTTPPWVEIKTDFEAFSPVGGGTQSEMIFRQKGSREQAWIGEIK